MNATESESPETMTTPSVTFRVAVRQVHGKPRSECPWRWLPDVDGKPYECMLATLAECRFAEFPNRADFISEIVRLLPGDDAEEKLRALGRRISQR